MLASKGIVWGSSSLLRNPQLQSAGMRLTSRQFSSLRPSTRPAFRSPSRTILPLTHTRFNSTLPTPTAVAAAEHAGTVPSEFALPSYIPTADSITNALPPDQLGYLKSLGLDYGFGPTSCLQYLLENIHLISDTPWWASIMLTVAVIRLAQFPFFMKMADTIARMKELNPQAIPLTKKMRDAQIRGDKLGMITTRQQIKELYGNAGVNRLWTAFPVSQIPIFYGFYRNLYGMAEVKVPGLIEGGNWWFKDLTQYDPYYILPLASSLSMGLQIHLGGEAGTSMQTKRMKQGMLLVLPIVSFAVVHSWPAALTLYFLTNSIFGLVQATALRNPWVRDKLGLYPLTVAASKNPLTSTGINALNIATKVPAGTVVEAGAPRQIGAKGGFLDRITGGDLKKDGGKKTWVDRILGEKVEGEAGGIGQMIKDNTEKAKYSEYEKKRQIKLDKLEAEERARRKRSMEGKR